MPDHAALHLDVVVVQVDRKDPFGAVDRVANPGLHHFVHEPVVELGLAPD